MYHLRCDKVIKLLESSIIYDAKAERGISGGPIIINEKGVYKLIGLHQGFQINFSRGVLLTTFGKSPFQILNDLSIPQNAINQLPQPLNN